MNPVIRNILAVVLGAVIGSAVNMALIIGGAGVIPAPAGVDVSSADSIAASMHLFEPRHFVFPFLAHALGTFVGAFVAYMVAASRKWVYTYAVACLFLMGGITNTFMIPAPMWFVVVDLLLAYLPMAWLGGLLSQKLSR